MVSLSEKVVRETLSTCPHCHKQIKAHLIEKDSKIYMRKQCFEHGVIDLLVSNHPQYYKNLTEYYFKVMPGKMKQKRYYIYLSNKCNLNCPICLLEPNQNKIPDMTLHQAKKSNQKKIGLQGSTCMERSQRCETILSNG